MLIYDCEPAPNPRRVRLYLAEKGIDVPYRQIDLFKGEQLGEAFRQVNPMCTVPYLVLDDGTGIGETMAICRYFEALQPQPALFGTTPLEQARVEMWSRVMELNGLFAVGEVFRNTAPGFKDRGWPGPVNLAQIPALAERGRVRVAQFYRDLEARLEQTPFLAGADFSVADITGFTAIEFAGWVQLGIPAANVNTQRWFDAIAARAPVRAHPLRL
ncbi:MAG: glutathione S-transferase [Gammaproteobacteria bacterium]|nr:glutathione S-transferase [Gammaproteobacteria bacterium]